MLAEDAAGQTGEVRLAVVAGSADDLAAKLERAEKAIASGVSEFAEPTGVAFADRGAWAGAKIAFLFPGQGSQAPDMLGEAAVLFPEIVAAFDAVDAALAARGFAPVGPVAYPPPAFHEEEKARQKAALAAPDASQPALAAAGMGLAKVLATLGVVPDVVAGHSFGELVALHAAGALSLEALAELSASRGRFLLAAVGDEPGAMAAVQGGPEEVEPLLKGHPGVVVANANGPRQTVLSGPREAIAGVVAAANGQGLRARPLPVACGFHSPLVAGARGPLAALASRLVERGPRLPVYSNVDARPYPDDPAAVAQRVGEHVANPVRFAAMVEALYQDGARVFVEVGPGAVLSPLVGSILGNRPHLAASCDGPAPRGVAALLAALGRLFVAGVALDPRPLTASRSSRRVALAGDRFERVGPAPSATTWLVNGSRARPAGAPEAPRLGPGPALPQPARAGSETAFGPTDPLPSRNGFAAHDEPLLPAAPGASDAVLQAFQATMRTFLDVQRSTMLSYLGASAAPAAPPSVPAAGPKVSPNGSAAPPPPKVQPTNGHPVAKPVEARKPDATDVEQRLLSIVRERTGYPAEMLRLDLDLEADLGIDSIKRVEIVGSLRDGLPATLNGSESELMDQLSRARTLGAIIDRVSRHLAPPRNGSATNGSAHPSPRSAVGPAARPTVRRMTLDAVDAPLPDVGGRAGLKAGGVVLVTDDRRGIADAAASRLRAEGYRVVRAVHSPAGDDRGAGESWAVDLTSPEGVNRFIERVRDEGPLCGVLHLLPLREAPEAGVDPSVWSERMAVEVRGLYLIARAAADDLARAAVGGGAALVAATGMGGALASLGDAPPDFFPGHGAIAGLVKTLAREWDAVRARVVDLDRRSDPSELAGLLVEELLAEDDRAEVGYRHGRRVALVGSESALPDATAPGVVVRPGEPILITGGARGITAAVARDLAGRWRPTLLLVGTSPLPLDAEEPDLEGLHDPAAIKARLLERRGRAGREVRPADLEREYRALRKAREIRANLRALRDLGATVEYASVDARDEAALRGVLGRWQERYGPLVGLVHGAGVIQDKLLRDKSPESFDRVVGTKLDGALALARLVDPSALRFAAFFSSVAGRFGNRGQADYAAANDALNKLAVWLDRRWPGRVVSMIWGPWSGVGMVSDLEGHLGRRGLGMIAPEEGRSRLVDELTRGRKGDVEVIVAGELGNLAAEWEVAGRS
jgi:malonyl CoA-acyl carrier protein transacylase/NAD(P)-dependent dehydrogenase (short-subunit alcohol dehydrogenase family)/acyl carrier protein